LAKNYYIEKGNKRDIIEKENDEYIIST